LIISGRIGCYRDGGGGNRVMTGVHRFSESMTIDMCQQFCQQSVNTYFGLEVRYCIFILMVSFNSCCIQKPDDRRRAVGRYTRTSAREVVCEI